ncbi:O-antigen ligase family protein [Brevundimonas balnearis]|uniref:O-antigen ligase family protein n=1 Tax=Brevundimonas balnearis TaxID=1572858 RepID=A0ABV6QZX6_9CAUL
MSRRRRASGASRATEFGPSRSGVAAIGWRGTALLAAAVAPLYGAHLLFGANQPMAAQALTALCGAILLVGLAVPRLRRALPQIKGLWWIAGLFALTLSIAIVSLGAGPPGAAHPIWAWADLPPTITVNRSATLLAISQLLGLAALFVFGALIAGQRIWGVRLATVFLAGGAIWAGIAILVFLSGAQIGVSGRLAGGFLSANSAATMLGVLVVMATGWLFKALRESAEIGGPDRWSRLALAVAPLMLLVFALILTGSRMGSLATLAGVLTLVVWQAFAEPTRSWRTLGVAAAICLMAAVAVGQGNDLVLRRVAALDQDVEVRSVIFAVHWRAFIDAPVWGSGLGSFTDVNVYLTSAETYGPLWSIRATHNVYLQWLQEAGLLGSLPMFALIGGVIAAAALRARTLARGGWALRAMIAANVVILVHGLTDYALQVPSISAAWALLLGAQFGFAQIRGRG